MHVYYLTIIVVSSRVTTSTIAVLQLNACKGLIFLRSHKGAEAGGVRHG